MKAVKMAVKMAGRMVAWKVDLLVVPMAFLKVAKMAVKMVALKEWQMVAMMASWKAAM